MRQIRNWVDHLSVKKKLVFYGYLTITPVLVVICLVLFFFNYRSGQQEKYASDYASVQTLAESMEIMQTDIRDFSTYISINNDIQKVWNIVLAVDKYNSWRSDLSKTEIINDKQFIEYTKNGYATTFTVTVAEPYKRWEFDMENSNMKGHWIGVFIDKGNETQIDFTENVIPKKWFMKPFVKTYLKKQQKQFVLDLKKALE